MSATPEDVAANAERVLFDGMVELGVDRAVLRRDAKLLDDLDVDSLDCVELAQIVEDEMGAELMGADLKDVVTAGDFIDVVVKKVLAG